MRTVTSVTTFNDAVGLRMSITYSDIDESSGKIITDNKRVDRIVTGSDAKAAAQVLFEYAQSFVETIE